MLRAWAWITRQIDRFTPTVDQSQSDRDNEQQSHLRLVVGVLLVLLVLIPTPVIEHIASGEFTQGATLAGGGLLITLLLQGIRRGLSPTVVAHIVTALLMTVMVVNSYGRGGLHSAPAIGFAIMPTLHSAMVRDRSAWVWCGIATIAIVGLALGPDGAPSDTREKAVVFATAGIALTTVGSLFETSRRRGMTALAEARERAEAAAEAKSRFLANMSHEIRTPLNGVLGMLGILLETRLDNNQLDYAKTAHSSGVALLDLLNDILDFSKIEAGQMLLEATPFDLRALVEDVLDQVAIPADEKGVELVSRYVPKTPTHVVADHGRIRQILLNLVSNAVKFTEEGHVLVTVEKVGSKGSKPILRCSIEDTGIGIPKDKQSRVFEHFQQVDASPSRIHQGTGLGLAIVRELVGLMNGRVGLSSTPGRGSTFWVELPVPVTTPTTDLRRRSMEGLLVLVVDDNRVNRWVLREQLVRWGFRLEEAESGPKALEALRSAQQRDDPVDIALLDYHMPQMDGLELTRAIKADPQLQDTVLIMLSSVTRRAETDLLLEAGCAAYLVKPIHQSELMNVMATAWMQHTMAPSATPESMVPPASDSRIGLASGRRILVVEDNAVNQKVAQRMLTNLGARVDVAGDGLEAIELIETIPYDLVFMDVQMPRMDGLTATAEIRRREGSTTTPLPIVAMTAHALPADRERCLAAGMNDYVSKPITRHELMRALDRHPMPDPEMPTTLPSSPTKGDEADATNTTNATNSTDVTDATDTTDATDAPHADEDTNAADTKAPCDLDWLRIHYDPDEAAIKTLVELYVTQSAELIAGLKDAHEAGDHDALARHAHTLKGISGSVKANAMFELLNREASEVATRLPEIERAYAEVRAFARRTLGPPSSEDDAGSRA